jgi:multisubunit Na+/H+ antiporter MnhB subunit
MLLLIDSLLALGLLWLGWHVVAGRQLFRSIVMFTVLGLLLALVWARLGSPDLALAEAAIGAGLTGAMLLLAYRRLLAIVPERAEQPSTRRSRLAWPVALLAGALVFALGWLLLELPRPTDSAGEHALRELQHTGIGNPVTGVLLLFRGFDTLLEMGVLLVAWLGVKAVQPMARPHAPPPVPPTPLLDGLLAAVVPSAVLIAGYLLHAGGQAPGGAFQAGAVLAAAGVLLVLCGRLETLREPLPPQRLLLVAGILVFGVLGAWGGVSGPAPMRLPGSWAVYLIEAALTVSIAISLLLLFLGSAGVRRRPGP